MQGTPNFRDFGGYRTADGRQVKWGFLFRSGQLSASVTRMWSCWPAWSWTWSVISGDWRSRRATPAGCPRDARAIASLPIIPGSNSRFFEEAESRIGRSPGHVRLHGGNQSGFRRGADSNLRADVQEILDLEDARFLVHCAAGKDRTGFAAAIILLALGVPREVVMRDYMLTSRFFIRSERLSACSESTRWSTWMRRPSCRCWRCMRIIWSGPWTRLSESFASLEAIWRRRLGVGPAELAHLRARYLD